MGVDAIMDMGRTSINVMGNCLACCVMSRLEGSFRGSEWKAEEEERRRKAYQGQRQAQDDASFEAIHEKDQQQAPDEQVPEILVHENKSSTKSLEIERR